MFEALPLKFVSFDQYPVLYDGGRLPEGDFRLKPGQRAYLSHRWYETLEVTTSAFVREKGVPMYAFALSTAVSNHISNDNPVATCAYLSVRRLPREGRVAYGRNGSSGDEASPGRRPAAFREVACHVRRRRSGVVARERRLRISCRREP